MKTISKVIIVLAISLLAVNLFAESCPTDGKIKYVAQESGCGQSEYICCQNQWINGTTCQCLNGEGKPNKAPYQYSNNTTPTAAQYKANASMCQFKWECLNGVWRSDPGTTLDFCACIGGYTWDSSSQTCKKTVSYVVNKREYTSCQSDINGCNGMKSTEYSGRMSSGGYVYGSITSSSCPGKSGFTQTSCSYNSSKGQYCYTSTVYSCSTK